MNKDDIIKEEHSIPTFESLKEERDHWVLLNSIYFDRYNYARKMIKFLDKEMEKFNERVQK